MAVNLACPGCRSPLVLREEYLSGDVQCPGCGHIFRASAPKPARVNHDERIADRQRRPPAPAPAKRQRSASRDDHDDVPRRRPQPASSSAGLWWAVGGAGAGLAVVLIVLIVMLVIRSTRGDRRIEEVAEVNNPAGAAAPVVPAAAAPIQAGPAVAPVPLAALAGEQIYQQLLKSTVFIEARTTTPGGGPGGIARPPMMKPPFAKKALPQVGALVQSVWEGKEDLPGYGKLTFEFFSPVEVTMIDAKDTSVGKWRLTGNSIHLDFGGAKYDGNLNGNTMFGSARNPDGTSWKWAVNKKLGVSVTQPPARSTVRSGTGALIDPAQRLVITNVHVVGNAANVNVHFARHDAKGDLLTNLNVYNDPVSARVVLREPRADLALVQLDLIPQGAQAVRLASKKAAAGQDVHSIGNPGASKALWIYSPGKVRAVFKDRWKIQDRETNQVASYDAMKIETTSPINPGDSGGPLVNDRGALVGVAHGQNLAANNLSYFIDVSEVRDVMTRYYQTIGQAWQPLTD